MIDDWFGLVKSRAVQRHWWEPTVSHIHNEGRGLNPPLTALILFIAAHCSPHIVFYLGWVCVPINLNEASTAIGTLVRWYPLLDKFIRQLKYWNLVFVIRKLYSEESALLTFECDVLLGKLVKFTRYNEWPCKSFDDLLSSNFVQD
jgi:hypothetical protein